MKRLFYSLGCIAISATLLFGGCARVDNISEAEPTQTQTVVVSGAVQITVFTVDELLDAIAPDTEITLAPGTYDLATAKNYGEKNVSPYYFWESTYSGYSLTIDNIQGLTIRGAGADMTEIMTSCLSAHVLQLIGCKNIAISDLRMGHRPVIPAGHCDGSVIVMNRCQKTDFNGLDLYGCGVVGIIMSEGQEASVENCHIFSCTLSAMNIWNSSSVRIENCKMTEIGNAYGGPLFSISNSDTVSITSNQVTDSYSSYLIQAYASTNITLNYTTVENNTFRNAIFDIQESNVTLDDNNIRENVQIRWFEAGSEYVQDPQGNILYKEENDAAIQWIGEPVEAIPVSTGNQKQVHVSTADEFLTAIGSDTEIIVDAQMIDLSEAADYGKKNGECYYWDDPFDGPELIISGVENLTIRGAGDDHTAHTISAVPRYADVLTFDNCSGITVVNLTAGHTKEPGSCMGGVLMFTQTDGFLVEKCGLFGCGILGIQSETCNNGQIIGNDIYECSYGGLELRRTQNVVISGNTFRELGGSAVSLLSCGGVTMDGILVDAYYSSN